MRLLPNEQLQTIGYSAVMLSNLRLRYSDKNYIFSIPISEICSLEYKLKKNHYYRYFGIVCLIVTGATYYLNYSKEVWAFFFCLAAVFFAVFFFSREQVIRVQSRGNSHVDLVVKGTNKNSVINFLEHVEALKQTGEI